MPHNPCPLGLKPAPIRRKENTNEKDVLANTSNGVKLTKDPMRYAVPREGSLDHKDLPSLVNGKRVYRSDSKHNKESDHVD